MIEIVSIHIPKTAGRSFLSILNSQYDPATIAHFDKRNYEEKDAAAVDMFIRQLNDTTKIIHGHFTYKDIAANLDLTKVKFISWVRLPVERVISNYLFFKKRISVSTDKELLSRKNESIIQYATLENSRNRMTKFIDGIDIHNFYFIGIVEQFEQDIKILSEMMKWKLMSVPRINDNSSFKKNTVISDSDREVIAELNKDDVKLYNRILLMRNKLIY